MDLIYKIYSVWLYDHQLNHDYVLFYDRKLDYPRGELSCDAPHYMFGYSNSASSKIYQMDKKDPDFFEKSLFLMKSTADRYNIKFIDAKDLITLVPFDERSSISYREALPGEVVETEGKYKGLKKNIYRLYNVMFNETKAGFNPHEFEVMSVWNAGDSQYSSYRIWQEVDERIKALRDSKLNKLVC